MQMDCATHGPYYNQQGDCIACCSETSEGGSYTIDPDAGTGEQGSDCAQLYAQSGGFDMTQLSYTEFQSLYCP